MFQIPTILFYYDFHLTSDRMQKHRGWHFYQPLNRDLSVSDQEWQRFSAQLPTENITRVITQWSRYGDEQFGGNTGWLAERFEVLLGNDLTLWFGLYSDPNYFKAIHSDINQQARYLDQYF